MAYVGPGAGFAVMSSFLALLAGLFYSAISVVIWPFRQLRRLLRARRAGARAQVKRLVILGLDGLDPELASRWIAEGKLPNLARLQEQGGFERLRTTAPPISPVAWSSFQTGVNPGKHAIFDFLARDVNTYAARLSSAEIRPGRHWFERAKARGLRKARPFWHYLGDAGIFSSVLRVPITFPAEKFGGVLLCGMCVPDLLGTQGVFSFHSTLPAPEGFPRPGQWFPFSAGSAAGWYSSTLPGPFGGVRFQIRATGPEQAEIEIQGRRHTLRRGVHSAWVQVRFGRGFRAADGICKFYLRQTAPELELYVTPVNIDPAKPSLPISHPFTYAVYLAKLLRPFATLGLAEDTSALNDGALDDAGFLEQCYQNHAERERMFFDALRKTPGGACICVFDTPDRVQHMMWRYHEPPRASGDPIEDLYCRMDNLVGRTLAEVKPNDLLLVISDHGFKSFRRSVNLNAWLHQNGYLSLKDGCDGGSEWLHDVDWQGTRAYALGLGGLYINQRGRERSGIVQAGEDSENLKAELRSKLKALTDPADGRPAVHDVLDAARHYTGPYKTEGPDLIIGYNAGYRVGWDSVTGRVRGDVFEDNLKAWSGDHCMHPSVVPGVLFSSRALECANPGIIDIAPTVLALFGLEIPRHFDGKPWKLGPPNGSGGDPRPRPDSSGRAPARP
jgi:predicted AlkP superfamily phosphohydrolase/phosphomutase